MKELEQMVLELRAPKVRTFLIIAALRFAALLVRGFKVKQKVVA